MEKSILIGGGVVLVILFILWRRTARHSMWAKQEMKKLRQEVEVIQAQLNQAQFFNLDVSGIEKKVEEDIEQMDSFVHQEFELVSGDVKELNERLETLEDENDPDTIETLENRIEAVENRLDAIEEKQG